MLCPVCKSVMMVIEYKQVELDSCPKCRGVWFDKGELDLLFNDDDSAAEKSVLHGITGEPLSGSREAIRKCPICEDKMRKFGIGETGNRFDIDICPVEHGIWFDGGEVEKLVQYLSSLTDSGTKQMRAFEFIREMFGADK